MPTHTERVRHTVRYTVSVTPAMDERLKQLLSKQDREVSMSDLCRIALRQYIDDQEDQIGSKRHFSKSLQTQLEALENHLLFYLNLLIFLESAK
jgi:Arc/MetJ-type ribon-helix-helix transcriptional regulator